MPDMKLKKPHTHAGRKYPAGAVIRNLRPDQADWLEALGVAEPLQAPTEAQAETAAAPQPARRTSAARKE